MPIDGSAMYCCPANRSRTASTPSMPGFFVTKSIHWNGPLRIQRLAELAPPFRPRRMTRPVDARAPCGVGPTCSGFRRIRPLNLGRPLWILPVSASAIFLRPCSPFTAVAVMGEPPASIPDRFNAAAFFVDRHMVEGRAGRPALYHEDRVVTYGQIFKTVNRVGNALLDLGVQMEDRVLLILLDGPEFVASFFGAMKLGAVPVPVNTLMRGADYRFFLDDSRAKVAIVSEPLLLEAGPALVQAKHLKHVVVVGEAKGPHLQFESWVSRAPRSLEAADTSKDDVAFWLYSSGSTGFPKAAVHLQHDMVVCSERYAKGILDITDADSCFSVAKLFFAYGLGNVLYFPLAVG